MPVGPAADMDDHPVGPAASMDDHPVGPAARMDDHSFAAACGGAGGGRRLVERVPVESLAQEEIQ